MWQAMILIWNKEQARANAAQDGDAGKTPAKQRRVVLTQDPDDTGD